jgi:hypothetical protein
MSPSRAREGWPIPACIWLDRVQQGKTRTVLDAILSRGVLGQHALRRDPKDGRKKTVGNVPYADHERVWVAVNQGQIEWSCSAVRIPSGRTMTSASSKRGGPNRTGVLLLKPMASFGMPKKFRSTIKLSFSS